MKAGRIIALIVGCLLLLPGIGLLLGGGGIGLGYAFGRDDAGYFELHVPQLQSPTAAITAPSPAVTTDLGTPTWLTEALRTDIRLRITPSDAQRPIFVGVGPADQVQTYLTGISHDEVTNLTTKGRPTFRMNPGAAATTPPADQNFWAATATGSGAQQMNFTAPNGPWTMVVMNADGSGVISAAATFEVKALFLLPLAVILFGLGLIITAGAIVLIVVGASGRRSNLPPKVGQPGVGRVGGLIATADYPVVLTARLDPGLSRWQWLVKWLLVIPHLVVLAFLWPAFLVVTVVAGVAILFTGVYPRTLFTFTTGVLRWSCRVSYYAAYGGIGTDRYPPFTLGEVPDYPVTLDIAYPAKLSRGLVLVKWWLLAIPHYLILSVMVGNWFGWTSLDNRFPAFGPVGGAGVLGLLVVIAGCVLLFTGRYPASLYDLIVGFNRWIYRVVAYAALMTDRYPPFRLDQGGIEPTVPPDRQPGGPTAVGPAAVEPTAVEPVGTRK
jgi:hypothetical protein